MTEKANNPDISRLIADIETLKNFIQNYNSVIRSLPTEKQDDSLFRLSLQVSGINFPEIVSELINLQQRLKNNLPEENSNVARQLRELQNEIAQKDEKIEQFKFSLADTVMDFKNLQKENNRLNEQIARLQNEIKQMQMHSKDLSLRLSNSEKEYKESSDELKIAKKQLSELKDQTYSLRSHNSELQDMVDNYSQEIENLKQKLDKTSVNKTRFQKLSDSLTISYEKLKSSHEALENRTSDLETDIDTLQKEKNHLKNKIDNLLTGIPRNVEYASNERQIKEGSVLEPVSFSPYLPFCFPERLPQVIKFKKQIKQSFARDYSKTQPAPIRAFPQNFKIQKNQVHTRKFSYRPEVNHSFPQSFSLKNENELPSLNKNFPLRENMVKRVKKYLAQIQEISLQKEAKISGLRHPAIVAAKRINLQQKPDFGIFTYSFDLLLSYMSRDIVESHYQELKFQQQHFETVDNLKEKPLDIEIANIFNENLAFRYGYQLKSFKLKLNPVVLLQSFKQRTGLKSVLETFGNTLSSMVNKYNFFSEKKNDTDENLKI